MKIIAIMGGGDWFGASVDYIEIPENMDLGDMKNRYDAWYNDEYCSQYRAGKKPVYKTFTSYLLEHGAIDTDKVEEYWE